MWLDLSLSACYLSSTYPSVLYSSVSLCLSFWVNLLFNAPFYFFDWILSFKSWFSFCVCMFFPMADTMLWFTFYVCYCVNKSGKSEHLCFGPDSRWKLFKLSSLSIMLGVGLSYMPFIMWQHILSIPNWLRVFFNHKHMLYFINWFFCIS